MGEIYRARHRDLNTEHAVKILLPRYAWDATFVSMMLDEAHLLQQVRHDAVVPAQGLLRDSDGRPLLVMNYLRGSTLATRLREGPLSAPDLVALTRRLAAGLGAIHAQGIVHQDISPDNIILCDDSCAEAKIIDFGLARTIAGSDVQGHIDFAGKYSWMSPEQMPGAPVPADIRCDLYSLGLVIVAASRGRKLEMGNDLESARAARLTTPSLDGVPAHCAALLRRLPAPDPRQRLSSAMEVAH